ncbi:L,D-transpeptidase family protein [Sphingorhabdus sp. Alg231-15]|uniref:L,D-transpeptidase family protein n=1 Tax=Sphingorhabdus sp. Alg231-15 TaxID=1922222 RepID=UPI00307C27D3
MLIRPFLLLTLTIVGGCSAAEPLQQADNDESAIVLPVIPAGTKADSILVDKSDRTLILYKGDKEIARYGNIRFGDTPEGHKRFEGDERTPEGRYTINGRNPGSSYHLSLRISYPNAADRAYAEARDKSPGGDIFIHGQPNGRDGAPIASDWTDGCIALSDAEIEQIWETVPDGAEIYILP